MRNLQKQVKKAFCYQKLFWPFTVRINCSSNLKFFRCYFGPNDFFQKAFWNQLTFSDLKNFENSWPSASNFKSFSQSVERFFLTVGQNNFGNKIALLSEQFWEQNSIVVLQDNRNLTWYAIIKIFEYV